MTRRVEATVGVEQRRPTHGNQWRAGRFAPRARARVSHMTWLGISIVLSLLLTVVVNVGLRVFPDAGRRIARAMTQPSLPSETEGRRTNHRLRLWTPWKAMLLSSVVLTIVVNLWLWLART